MKKASAISLMYHGQKGNMTSIPKSEKSSKAIVKAMSYSIEFKKQLEKYPELLDKFQTIEKLEDEYIKDIKELAYSEGFRFGLLLGVEVAHTPNCDEYPYDICTDEFPYELLDDDKLPI